MSTLRPFTRHRVLAADQPDADPLAPQPIADAELQGLFGALRPNRTIALAVSGGTDSLALAVLAARWRRHFAPAVKLLAYVVDHSLRDGSHDEALNACAMTHSWGIESRLLKREGPVPESGIQARARLARYDLMAAQALIDGTAVLLTAHTAGDQAETVLMRARRGEAEAGLQGIPEWGEWSGLAVHRPLMSTGRERLAATLAAMGLNPIEDPSNDDSKFERVRMRKLLASQPNPRLACDSLCRLAEIAAEKQASLADQAAGLFNRHGTYHPQGFVTLESDALFESFGGLCLLLSAVIHRVGGQVRPPRREQVVRLAEQLADVDSAHRVRSTLARARVVMRDGRLHVFREIGRNQADFVSLTRRVPAIFDRRFRVLAKQDCMAGYATEDDLEAMAAHLAGNDVPSVIARAVAGGFPTGFGSEQPDLAVRPLPIYFGRHQVHSPLETGASLAVPPASVVA